jgi:hypothetical protein
VERSAVLVPQQKVKERIRKEKARKPDLQGGEALQQTAPPVY